jgi:predicted ribosome quality control (RQC) complex YloA/Tae2 family protein
MKVIAALKTVDFTTSSLRQVLPGMTYELPPAQDKLDLRETEPADACQRILSLENSKLSSAIIKSLQGVSPLLSRELAYRACGDDKAVAQLTTDDKMSLFTEISTLKTMLVTGEISPSIVLDEAEKPMEFSFMPITQYGESLKVICKPDVFSLLEGFYSERDRVLRTRSKAWELFKTIDNLIERTGEIIRDMIAK